MNCPMCKKSTQVKDSRAYEDNQVRRRRVCIGCKYSFYTLETRETEKINVNKLRRGVNQVTSGMIRPGKKKVLPARRQEPRNQGTRSEGREAERAGSSSRVGTGEDAVMPSS